MSYVSSGRTHSALIDNLKRHRLIRSARVEAAMRRVDRRNYVEDPAFAYSDAPQGIGYGVTISAPHMHAVMLEELADHVKEGARVLDVGCGSGYLTACLAYLAGESGLVVGIEHLYELVELSRNNIRHGNPELLSPVGTSESAEGQRPARVKLVFGDGRLGWEEDAPYDAIHVGAGAEELPPALVKQLKPGGRIVCPVGDFIYGGQRLMRVDKGQDGRVHVHELMDVMFVPLCDADDQWSGPRMREPPPSLRHQEKMTKDDPAITIAPGPSAGTEGQDQDEGRGSAEAQSMPYVE